MLDVIGANHTASGTVRLSRRHLWRVSSTVSSALPSRNRALIPLRYGVSRQQPGRASEGLYSSTTRSRDTRGLLLVDRHMARDKQPHGEFGRVGVGQKLEHGARLWRELVRGQERIGWGQRVGGAFRPGARAN